MATQKFEIRSPRLLVEDKSGDEISAGAFIRQADGGFTFIEVLVALAIVSISILALLRLHLMSIRMTEKAQETIQAVFLAEQKIAETLTEGYPKEASNCGTVEGNGVLFSWRTEVTDLHLLQLDQIDIAGLREILVDVSYKQGIGRSHVQMSTYVADRKLP